jgi:DNA-binding MarR family transcriptional regulator
MNKIAQKPRPAPTPSDAFDRRSAEPGGDSLVVEQARTLDSTLMAVARQVLVDDDAAAELPLRQFRVCMALYDGPRSMSHLSRDLRFSLSAMTQIADRLERAGMVTRWFEGTDRRVRRLRLTPRARRMLRLREEDRIRRIAAMLSRMPESARDSALQALQTLRLAADSDRFEHAAVDSRR